MQKATIDSRQLLVDGLFGAFSTLRRSRTGESCFLLPLSAVDRVFGINAAKERK